MTRPRILHLSFATPLMLVAGVSSDGRIDAIPCNTAGDGACFEGIGLNHVALQPFQATTAAPRQLLWFVVSSIASVRKKDGEAGFTVTFRRNKTIRRVWVSAAYVAEIIMEGDSRETDHPGSGTG